MSIVSLVPLPKVARSDRSAEPAMDKLFWRGLLNPNCSPNDQMHTRYLWHSVCSCRAGLSQAF